MGYWLSCKYLDLISLKLLFGANMNLIDNSNQNKLLIAAESTNNNETNIKIIITILKIK